MIKAFALASAALVAASLPALACSGTIRADLGTVVQYRNSSGTIRTGVIVDFVPGPPQTWSIVSWQPTTGAIGFNSGVTNDQTQTTNNTFAVYSCSAPF